MVLGTGYSQVDSDVTCVLTRFEVRSLWALLRFYVLFRRVKNTIRGLDGLIAALFIVENARTCYTLSVWRDVGAILKFNTEPAHIAVANYSFRELRSTKGKVHLWSGQFRLAGASPHNFVWPGIDFKSFVRSTEREGT